MRPRHPPPGAALALVVTAGVAFAALLYDAPQSDPAATLISSAADTTTPRTSAAPAEPATPAYSPNAGDSSFQGAELTRAANGPVVRGNARATREFRRQRPEGGLMAIAAVGDPARGVFSPVMDWPLVAIHAVLTPDGRVLSYGTKADGTQTGYYIYDVWDPQLGLGIEAHTVLPNQTAVDLFCNAQVLLPGGDIEMYGGDVLRVSTDRSSNLPTDDMVLYRPLDDSLTRTGRMFRKRWYATATTLPSGEVFVQGGDGGRDFPEVRQPDNTFRLLTGASTDYLSRLYPRNFLAPDGKIFGVAYTQMYRIDPAGAGTLIRAGKFNHGNSGGSSSAVMYRPGRILQVGGGTNDSLASRNASTIDIRPATPTVSSAAAMTHRRHWPYATVLPNGRVFVSGGSTMNNDPAAGVAYTSEIWNPSTNSWSLGATAQQMRLYHATALLMPDATVLTIGGGALGAGLPGPQLNLNAELYYPGYLFNADGTPAARPTIDAAPMTVEPSSRFRIATPLPAGIARVTLVRTGSVTHSLDMDQRFLELPFTVVDGELEATLPANRFDTPPGFYMLFLLDAAGVPSEAAMLRINVAGATPPPLPATLTVTKVVVNDDGRTTGAAGFRFSVNGATPVTFEGDGSNSLSVPPGTYTVTEPAVAGYATSYANCSNVVLAAGGSTTCTITNDDVAVVPATLTVTKIVVNDNGGGAGAGDFGFAVNGGTPHAFEADGSNSLSLPAGTYSVTEPAVAGYATTYAGCSNIVLAEGGTATCTITNDDVDATPATLTVTKVVVNDSGGSAAAASFGFSVNGGAPVPFEPDGSNALSVVPGSYTITEPVAAGYTTAYSGCSGLVLAAGGTATCTITNNDVAPPPTAGTNLLVNGDFEVNTVPNGVGQLVSNLSGWTNTAGAIDVWRNRLNYVPGSGHSNIEIDSMTGANTIYQDVATVAGATYDLSFLQSPRSGAWPGDNQFDVFWNGTRVATIRRDGSTLSGTSWQRSSFVVTGTGNDRLSFREYDASNVGALLDDVRLVAR